MSPTLCIYGYKDKMCGKAVTVIIIIIYTDSSVSLAQCWIRASGKPLP